MGNSRSKAGKVQEQWDFSNVGKVYQPKRWNWEEFHALPRETITRDIHCVTKWSKLDTHLEGVSLDTLLAQVEISASFVIAFSDEGYTTNLPLVEQDEPGFWESASLQQSRGSMERRTLLGRLNW